MKSTQHNHSIWLWGAGLLAVLFGALTIISGGRVLFNEAARHAAGDYVSFIVWFNFLAGFAYVIAGAGLFFLRSWSAWLSILIAGATLFFFALFGVHIWSGGAYELRTVVAMGLRLTVWLAIALVAYRSFNAPISFNL